MTIAVFGNLYRAQAVLQLNIILDFLLEHQVEILLDGEWYENLKNGGFKNIEKIGRVPDRLQEADMALSIGGDGTFLSTAARIGSTGIPILGVNAGRLGFLADVPGDEIIRALNAVIHGNYRIEKRTLLEINASDGTAFDYPYALNEISVSKQDTSSMISVTASVNGDKINTYQADGLIISTPTGSTAYSMSVGGPLVVPQAENFIISPVASHSMTVRPLIIPDSWVIDLEVISRTRSFLVSLDGRSKVLEQGTKLKISRAGFVINVVKQPDQTFFDTLKNKLMWGADRRIDDLSL